MLDRKQIELLIPHRGWALFLETADVDGLSARGIACWERTHPHLAGHFPAFPIVPGVFLLEAFAQLAGAVLICGGLAANGQIGMLSGVKRMLIHRPVEPDERIEYGLTITQAANATFFVASGLARNGRQEKVISVDATVAIVDRSRIEIADAIV